MPDEQQNDENWNIARMMQWMQGYLQDKGDGNPRISTQWLLTDATGLSRTDLFTQFDRPLSKEELDILRDSVKRRASGEPLQYITGNAPFRYLNLIVRPGVLIPRPETEVLVSEVLFELPKPKRIRSAEFLEEMKDIDPASIVSEGSDLIMEAPSEDDATSDGGDHRGMDDDMPDEGSQRHLLIADICTGSGCIACALATEHPDISVIATDISDDAVELASLNAKTCDVADRVEVLKSDLGDSIDASRIGTFDAVVSNPPYVPTDVLGSLSSEVADFEPRLALDGGYDGLDVFKRIVAWAYAALKPRGLIAFELFEDSMNDAQSFLIDSGFGDIRIVDDLTGKPRVITAYKKG